MGREGGDMGRGGRVKIWGVRVKRGGSEGKEGREGEDMGREGEDMGRGGRMEIWGGEGG